MVIVGERDGVILEAIVGPLECFVVGVVDGPVEVGKDFVGGIDRDKLGADVTNFVTDVVGKVVMIL